MRMYYYVNIKERDHGVVFADSEDEAKDILVKVLGNIYKTTENDFVFRCVFNEVHNKHVCPFGYLNAY